MSFQRNEVSNTSGDASRVTFSPEHKHITVSLSALYLFASNKALPYIPPLVNTDNCDNVIMQ